ncbi:uncharacterized protein G2W53_040880 [Senna tora]|uniref:Uncharacterized protein n=1 Tax=Senna tora TaxID=362788 RepID=A0A834W2E7_9FABA|nr:uncharacterized protein G2W53_040880 [Senna tora]
MDECNDFDINYSQREVHEFRMAVVGVVKTIRAASMYSGPDIEDSDNSSLKHVAFPRSASSRASCATFAMKSWAPPLSCCCRAGGSTPFPARCCRGKGDRSPISFIPFPRESPRWQRGYAEGEECGLG